MGLLALMLLIESRRAARTTRGRRPRAAGRSGPRALGPRADRRGPGASCGAACGATSPGRTRSRPRSTPCTATRRPRPTPTGGRSSALRPAAGARPEPGRRAQPRGRGGRGRGPGGGARARRRPRPRRLPPVPRRSAPTCCAGSAATAEAASAYEAAIARTENAAERESCVAAASDRAWAGAGTRDGPTCAPRRPWCGVSAAAVVWRLRDGRDPHPLPPECRRGLRRPPRRRPGTGIRFAAPAGAQGIGHHRGWSDHRFGAKASARVVWCQNNCAGLAVTWNPGSARDVWEPRRSGDSPYAPHSSPSPPWRPRARAAATPSARAVAAPTSSAPPLAHEGAPAAPAAQPVRGPRVRLSSLTGASGHTEETSGSPVPTGRIRAASLAPAARKTIHMVAGRA